MPAVDQTKTQSPKELKTQPKGLLQWLSNCAQRAFLPWHKKVEFVSIFSTSFSAFIQFFVYFFCRHENT